MLQGIRMVPVQQQATRTLHMYIPGMEFVLSFFRFEPVVTHTVFLSNLSLLTCRDLSFSDTVVPIVISSHNSMTKVLSFTATAVVHDTNSTLPERVCTHFYCCSAKKKAADASFLLYLFFIPL